MKRRILATCIVTLLLPACAPQATPLPIPSQTPTFARLIPTPRYDVPTQDQITVTREAAETPPSAPITESTSTNIPSADSAWMDLPVIPSPGENIREIYRRGLSLGNDPNAFSIFGDCQAKPDEFFGVFETDPSILNTLSPQLRETVKRFDGSFNRESSTAQDGTTPGALLWSQWHRGEFGCTFLETPVECELRTHSPSFVIIQVGSHFESRNTEYLRRVIVQLIEKSVVPILATKADNRELDHRVNRDMALLAAEFNLPLWNFWAALEHLPNRGLYTRKDRPLQGDIYLTEEAQTIHRMTGLEALDIVWRMAAGQ